MNDHRKNNCPNCNSSRFFESISHESCLDCRYEFVYGGQGIPSGGNDVCKAMHELAKQEWLREQHEWAVELMMGHYE